MEKISYSQLDVWNTCPHKYRLRYIDNVDKFSVTEFTAFGRAIHSAAEMIAKSDKSFDAVPHFNDEFFKEIKEVKESYAKEDKEIRKDLVLAMLEQGSILCKLIRPTLDSHFPNYEIFSVEERLKVPIDGEDDVDFKGFVDLVIKDRNGRIIMIDWKSCSWGWDSKKRTDKMKAYQLVLYKHFFSKKHDIPPENIDVYFGLLKRTAKKDNTELFKITSGPKRAKNALKLLSSAIYNIDSGFLIKNRTSCSRCDFYKTEYCK